MFEAYLFVVDTLYGWILSESLASADRRVSQHSFLSAISSFISNCCRPATRHRCSSFCCQESKYDWLWPKMDLNSLSTRPSIFTLSLSLSQIKFSLSELGVKKGRQLSPRIFYPSNLDNDPNMPTIISVFKKQTTGELRLKWRFFSLWDSFSFFSLVYNLHV